MHLNPLVAEVTDRNGSDNLKNLNASQAAGAVFANASSNSNVGKFATYQDVAADLTVIAMILSIGAANCGNWMTTLAAVPARELGTISTLSTPMTLTITQNATY